MRSGVVRRANAEALKRLKAGLPELLPVPVQLQAEKDTTRTQTEDLELVQEQIKLACEVLNDRRYHWCEACERGGLEPHHRAQLLKSLDVLLDRKGVLLGIHKPGPSKPPRELGRRFQAVVLPMEEPAQIAPIVASTPQRVVSSSLVAIPEMPQDITP